jgi:hypothetical protein
VTQQRLVADFLRSQAAWRLARSQHDPVRSARCAAALLDAAAYAAALADDDANLAMLALVGCFRGEVFDPGPAAVSIARWWRYRESGQVGPGKLIEALAVAAGSPGVHGCRQPG